MLDDITLYWLTSSETSSAQLYRENNGNVFNTAVFCPHNSPRRAWRRDQLVAAALMDAASGDPACCVRNRQGLVFPKSMPLRCRIRPSIVKGADESFLGSEADSQG